LNGSISVDCSDSCIDSRTLSKQPCSFSK
jgi:hypothetical protein